MDAGAYRSSEAQIYLIRYGSLFFGLLCLGQEIRRLAWERGSTPTPSIWVLSVLLLTLFIASRGKFGVVTVEVGGLFVQQNGERFKVAWEDVVSFHPVGFLARPVYRLVFRGRESATYLVPPPHELLSLPWCDMSGMAKFIRSRLLGHGALGKEPPRWRHDL